MQPKGLRPRLFSYLIAVGRLQASMIQVFLRFMRSDNRSLCGRLVKKAIQNLYAWRARTIATPSARNINDFFMLRLPAPRSAFILLVFMAAPERRKDVGIFRSWRRLRQYVRRTAIPYILRKSYWFMAACHMLRPLRKNSHQMIYPMCRNLPAARLHLS